MGDGGQPSSEVRKRQFEENMVVNQWSNLACDGLVNCSKCPPAQKQQKEALVSCVWQKPRGGSMSQHIELHESAGEHLQDVQNNRKSLFGKFQEFRSVMPVFPLKEVFQIHRDPTIY